MTTEQLKNRLSVLQEVNATLVRMIDPMSDDTLKNEWLMAKSNEYMDKIDAIKRTLSVREAAGKYRG